MIKLIRAWFDLWCRERWLKYIDKACDKYNKLEAKAKRQAYVVHALFDRYKELYPDDFDSQQT